MIDRRVLDAVWEQTRGFSAPAEWSDDRLEEELEGYMEDRLRQLLDQVKEIAAPIPAWTVIRYVAGREGRWMALAAALHCAEEMLAHAEANGVLLVLRDRDEE
jgi:hypothetical protein